MGGGRALPRDGSVSYGEGGCGVLQGFRVEKGQGRDAPSLKEKVLLPLVWSKIFLLDLRRPMYFMVQRLPCLAITPDGGPVLRYSIMKPFSNFCTLLPFPLLAGSGFALELWGSCGAHSPRRGEGGGGGGSITSQVSISDHGTP